MPESTTMRYRPSASVAVRNSARSGARVTMIRASATARELSVVTRPRIMSGLVARAITAIRLTRIAFPSAPSATSTPAPSSTSVSAAVTVISSACNCTVSFAATASSPYTNWIPETRSDLLERVTPRHRVQVQTRRADAAAGHPTGRSRPGLRRIVPDAQETRRVRRRPCARSLRMSRATGTNLRVRHPHAMEIRQRASSSSPSV